MASRRPGPAAGSAAALATAAGAALLGKTARLSHRQLDDADALADAADALRARALALTAEDAAGVAETLSSSAGGPADRSAVPRQIGGVAAAVGQLAGRLAERGNPRLHADAVAAGHLAAAASATVDAIVRSNEGAPG